MADLVLQQTQILDGKQKIKLRITGDEMNAENGYRLDGVLTSLHNFEQLINKTYLHINERSRLKDSDYDKVSIRLLSVEEGSFLSTLTIVYNDLLIPSLPLLIDNSEMLWGSIKLAYDFIKIKINAIKEGKEVMVTQTASENGINVANNANGTINITVNQGIPELADKLKPQFRDMTRIIDGDDVSGIEITDTGNNTSTGTLSLDKNAKELFKKTTYTEDDEISIIGKIMDGNYSKQNGKIIIEDSSVIPGGEYKFSVSDNLHAEEKWREMFLQERPYYCKRRVEYDPNSQADQQLKILEIIITDWDEIQWDNI